MKRYLLILGGLLLSLALKAQSSGYSCRYWFDMSHEQAASATFNSSNWQAQLDVGSLTEGLHTIHVQVKDNSLDWATPKTYLFLKAGGLGTDNTDMSQPIYHCWFNQDFEHRQTASLGNGNFLLNVDNLPDGMHTVHMMLEGEQLTSVKHYLFMKTGSINVNPYDMSQPNYHCWFDQDFEHEVTASLGNGHLLLNVEDMKDGLHILNLFLEGNVLSSTKNYLFLKPGSLVSDTTDMSEMDYYCWFDLDYEHRQTGGFSNAPILLDVEDLLPGLHTLHVMLKGNVVTTAKTYMFVKVLPGEPEPLTALQYRFWYDLDDDHVQTGALGGGVFQIDVSDLTDGLHTLHVQLDNGRATSTRNFVFLKAPAPAGDYGIAKWEYLLNDDNEHRHTTELDPALSTLDIVSLLPVETWPIRSTSFHFHPNGNAPYINAKNEIKFRFYDNNSRFVEKTAIYVDMNVQQVIEADVLERNTTTTIAAPTNNQIHWFKMAAVAGDSLSFKSNKACTMHLFSPSGEEVYTVTSSASMNFGGCHAWENGDYYLAVHDANGNYDNIEVSYQWLNRYAVLSLGTHTVGNGGYSSITVLGNGFNNLQNVYLVNSQNEIIDKLDIGHESIVSTSITFDFSGASLGDYDMVFQFADETIQIEDAIQVETPNDIYLTATVSYPTSFLSGSDFAYTFEVTNTGNMSAYAIPIYFNITTPEMDYITHLEIEGLRLPSILDYLEVDWDTVNNAETLKQQAQNLGDDHYFFKRTQTNEGGSRGIRSAFFFADFGPNETRTFKLNLTATSGPHEPLEAWMTVPSGLIYPRTSSGSSNTEYPYCCVQENIACTYNAFQTGFNVGTWFPNLSQTSFDNCIGGKHSEYNETISHLVCVADNNNWFAENRIINHRSVVGSLLSCASQQGAFVKTRDAISFAVNFNKSWSFDEMLSEIPDCVRLWSRKNPDCPIGQTVGGVSDGRTPGDPNDIFGYTAESGSRYMRQEITNVCYEIEFENDTALATAAAHTIIVRDTLDATKFDLSSVAARKVTVGSHELILNGEKTFVRTIDLRPDHRVIAQVQQNYNETTGVLEWVITSLDPMTMEPVTDPNIGVLPVNYYGDGVGTITYGVKLKNAFADGTQISNRAGIIFDSEKVIMTPTWTNTVDAVKPTSGIASATPLADSLCFQFASNDARSGIWCHNLYYRNENTSWEWEVKKTQISGNTFATQLEELVTTEYAVIAIDSAGNQEEKSLVGEFIFNPENYHYYTLTLQSSQDCGSVTGAGTFVEGSNIVVEAVPGESCHFVQWNDENTQNPRTVLMTNNITLTAQFDINQYLVEVTSANELMGTVTGGDTFDHGASVTVIATPNYGYHFAYWMEEGSIVSFEESFTFTATCERSLTAYFEQGSQTITQSAELASGWSWWSTYIEQNGIEGLTILEEGLGVAGVMIKTKNAYARVNANHTWYGSLKSINNETGYKIQTSAACDIDMTGSLATSGDHPITIGNGWNWIGYPVMTAQSPNVALSGFQPENKDVIKGQSGYARYDSNSGTWKPASFTLVPGRSYLYYSNATESKSMTFVTGRNERSVETEECHWTGDVHAFPDNNCILAIVKVDGVEQRDNALELGAFVDGQCRGSVRLMHDDDYDRYFAMLTVTAQDGEEIHFGVFDHQSGEASMNCATSMNFESDAIIGDFTSPFEINLTTRRNENANMSVYPNPMDRNQLFSIQLPDGEQATGVTITDAMGALIRCEMGGINMTMIDGFQTAGVYVLHVTCASGNVYHHKLVVK